MAAVVEEMMIWEDHGEEGEVEVAGTEAEEGEVSEADGKKRNHVLEFRSEYCVRLKMAVGGLVLALARDIKNGQRHDRHLQCTTSKSCTAPPYILIGNRVTWKMRSTCQSETLIRLWTSRFLPFSVQHSPSAARLALPSRHPIFHCR